MDALSNCDVMAAGNGNNLASSVNSAFSFSLLDLAAFLLFSFIAWIPSGTTETTRKPKYNLTKIVTKLSNKVVVFQRGSSYDILQNYQQVTTTSKYCNLLHRLCSFDIFCSITPCI